MLSILKCIVLTAGISAPETRLKVVNQELEALKLNLNTYTLLASMIAVESRFEPLAKSGANARGLLQLTPIAIEQVRRISNLPVNFDVYNIRHNINIAYKYKKYLTSHYGYSNIELLVAYNSGQSNVKTLRNMTNLNKETANYVSKVLFLKEKCLSQKE